MTSLAWKFNRLRMMGPAEIIWRGKKAIQARLERERRGRAPHPPQEGGSWGRIWLNTLPSGFDSDLYQGAADRVLAGQFDVFALRGVQLGFPPRWNRDPKSGIDAPLHFGKMLDYRDQSVVGDIKYLWEPNRHYELLTLAQAFHLSRQHCYAEASRVLLTSWFLQCPYPFGPNWSSALEHSVRLLNWAVAWHLLGGVDSDIFGGEDGKKFRQHWLDSIYQHCHFIDGHFSRYSSANNHLFGEYMGLFIGATTWPCWKESSGWISLAKKGLEQEALIQNAADGVNREQGIWYHHEVADMMLLSGLSGRANGIEFSEAYWKRLETMLEFVLSVMDVAGNVPMIGDSDDAVMLRFSQEAEFDVYRSLLATGAVLFKRADFKTKATRFDDKSRWLLGDQGADTFASLNPAPAGKGPSRAFPQGGYYILGKDFETLSEFRIVADAGPLGYLSIAAHGHADALAFTLSVAGKVLLIDPGTYAYHTQKKWRNYFRGTSAHNTVRVDGLDQSESGGNFMWLHKANACCDGWETSDERDCFIGSHDGYLRLADPVMHRRKIVFLKRERTLVVEDILECRKVHEIEFCWHFADTCKIVVDERKVLATSGNVRVEMTMPDCDCEPEVVVGREDPPLGWISRRFDEKVPSPSIIWNEKINGTTRRVTVFHLGVSGILCKRKTAC